MFGHGRLCHDCDFDIVKQIVIPIVICIVVITIFVINDIDTFSNSGLGRCFGSSPGKPGSGLIIYVKDGSAFLENDVREVD